MTHESNVPFQNRPPRSLLTDQEDSVFSDATGAAAASADIWTGYAAHPVTGSKVPEGKVWLELEAVTQPCYVRFARTATTATTTSDGFYMATGIQYRFLVDPSKDLFLDHLAPAGAAVIKWRRVGPIVDRSRV